MITLFWVWLGFMLWFVPGYMTAKACYRDTKEVGTSWFFLLCGPIFYFPAWFGTNATMRAVHGLKPRDPDRTPLTARLLGEVKK